MSAAHRLDRATAILDGTVTVPVEQRVVAAAHLARSGLELAVAEVFVEHGLDLRRAWMASRLTVLSSVVGADLGGAVRFVWTALSRTCHRHAFELSPGEWEVRSLIVDVRVVVEQIYDTSASPHRRARGMQGDGGELL